MMISYVFLLFIKEENPNPSQKLFSQSEFFRRLFTILKKEKNYRNFLVFDSLMMLANMSQVFFAVYAIEKFSLPESYAGTFTIVMMTSMIIGSLFFGYTADRYGHRINLLWASAFTGIASLVALISPYVISYYLVFVGASLNLTVLMVSRLTIIAEICSEDDRPTYVALTNMVTAPFVLSGMLGGIIVDSFGFKTLFIIAIIFSFAAMTWLKIKVIEPRSFPIAIQSNL
jgi:MFS family permease